MILRRGGSIGSSGTPADGQLPAPYWKATRVQYDTRLMPDQVDRVRFLFEAPEAKLTVVARLLYPRFSKYLADQKSWPDNEVLITTKRWSSPDAADGREP